jgi:hypothetical protein
MLKCQLYYDRETYNVLFLRQFTCLIRANENGAIIKPMTSCWKQARAGRIGLTRVEQGWGTMWRKARVFYTIDTFAKFELQALELLKA